MDEPGRAGAQGISLSFCDEEEKEYLHDIHKLIRKTIPVVEDQPYHMTHVGMARPQAQTKQRTSFNQEIRKLLSGIPTNNGTETGPRQDSNQRID